MPEAIVVAVEVGRHLGPAAVQAAITAQKAASFTTVAATDSYKWYDLDYVILVFTKGNLLNSAGRTAVGASFVSNELEVAVDSTGLTTLTSYINTQFTAGKVLIHAFELVERNSKVYAFISMSN